MSSELPRLGYTGSLIDRAANRRTDRAWLDAQAQADGTAVYVIGGEWVLLRRTGDTLDAAFNFDEAAAFGTGERIFLGLLDGVARFGFGIAPDEAEKLKERSDLAVIGLRAIAVDGLVGPDHLPPLAEAKAVLHWHARHRFCANCGAATKVADAGWRRECPACQVQHFPRTDPVAIMLVSHGDSCLLGRSGRFATNFWSCLAGFVEPGESIEDAVRREVLEEAGIRCGSVTYRQSQPWPFPSSLMIGCHAEALTTEITVDREELEDARWFTREEAAQMLAKTHPDGLSVPPPVAIAHHLIRDWIHGDG